MAPTNECNTRAMFPKGLLAFKVFLIYLRLLRAQWNGKAYRLFLLHTQGTENTKF